MSFRYGNVRMLQRWGPVAGGVGTKERWYWWAKECPGILPEILKVWLFAPWSGNAKDVARQGSCGSHMISISEELRAGKAAKAAINVLSPATLSKVRATLTKAKHDAIFNMSSGGTLNEARANVGIALSNLIHSQPTQEKIDKAKSAIQTWIQQLEAAKP
jgi:hypothetical protein